MKVKKEYKTLMINKDLKDLIDSEIKKIGIDMSYSAYIKYLINKNNKSYAE
jgi:hypothetical protein